MTTPPPITEPDPSALICPGDKVGPCAACQRETHKNGSGGLPLCQWCMASVRALGIDRAFVSTHV